MAFAIAASSCHSASRSAATQTPVPPMRAPDPTPTPPVYVALDYGKPGQHVLRAVDIAQIRKVLHELKPCQRELLRYIASEQPIAVFFAVKTAGSLTTAPHVFGTNNLYYFPIDGTVKPAMSEESDEQTIADQAYSD
ncbi:MAG: hypothetical protein WA668_17055 [Candidatus Cybelea sp.]